MSDHVKVGLSLAGGGSKGAYQAGMAKALAEADVPVREVAGASVGALNGAVLASAPSLEAGAKKLERLWLDEAPFFLRLILAGVLERFGYAAAAALLSTLRKSTLPLALLALLNDDRLLSPNPLRNLLNKCLDSEELAHGLPLHVSVYESSGGVGDLLRLLAAKSGIVDTPKSTFKKLQELPDREQIECLLASMALPIIFQGLDVQGKRYSDGGQGGWQTRQGNTPVEPLVRAGCNLVIVMHTEEGSPWGRRNYPETTFIEIRPQHEPSSIPFGDLLETNKTTLLEWIDQGYKDAYKQVGRVVEVIQAANRLRWSKHKLANAESTRLTEESSRRAKEARLAEAMEDFKKRI